jgi:hypothetical protein
MRGLRMNDIDAVARRPALAAATLLVWVATGCGGGNGGVVTPDAADGGRADSTASGGEDRPPAGDDAGGDAAIATIDASDSGATPDSAEDAGLAGDQRRDGLASDSMPREGGGTGSTDGSSDGASDSPSDGLPSGLRALMVTNGAATPTAGDAVMRGRLRSRGVEVTLISDVAVTAASVTGQDFVVISSSAESGPLGTKIRDVAVPVICIENGAFPTMALTGTRLATDYGSTFNQTTVNIVADATALAGTLTGAVVIASVPSELGWAVPAASALVGARMADDATHAALFGYRAGSQMAGLIAPARRVGFAIRETLAASLTADGLTLFDAAVTFALTRD